MPKRILQTLALIFAIVYCLFVSLYLMATHDQSTAFVALGFLLAIALAVHSSIKAYLIYQAKQREEERLRELQERLRQEREKAEFDRLEAIRLAQESEALAKQKAERALAEEAARLGDIELERRDRGF